MKHLFVSVALMSAQALAEEPVEARAVVPRLTLLAGDMDLKSKDFSTGLHLGLTLRSPELTAGLRAEAEVSLFALANNQGSLGLRDNASFVRLVWRPVGWSQGEELALSVLPLSATRLHLGYEFPATWGRFLYTLNSDANTAGIQGAELRLTRLWGCAFIAAKSTVRVNALTYENERLSTGLMGAGVDLLPEWRLEAAGALAQHGQIPIFSAQGIERRTHTLGLSGRVLYHRGAPIGPSVDFTLYQRDPSVYETLFAPELYPGGVSASVSLEATHLAQELITPRDPGELSPVGADVLALQGRLKVNALRVHALALYRSLSFILSEVPGVYSFNFPITDGIRAERMLTVGADYHFTHPSLTPGLLFRALWPAAFSGSDVLVGPGSSPGKGRLVVVRDYQSYSILPEGYEPQPVFLAKATLRWDVGAALAVIAEAFYTHDPNLTTFVDDPATGMAHPVSSPPSSEGFSLLLQARF